MAELPKIESCYCNKCMSSTRHEIIFSTSKGVASDGWRESGTNYQVMECRGCGNITFRKRDWDSEWIDEDGHFYEDSYFPPLVSRRIPEWLSVIPFEIRSVMDEVYAALHAGSRYLATVGARTALDMVMVAKIGDIGSFHKKIEKLKTDGHITEAEAELINAVTEAGNASAHRGYAPGPKDINSVIDILESVLDKFYFAEKRQGELAAKAAALRKRIPPRDN